MKIEERYNILLETVRVIGSYKVCNCGCPDQRAARIVGTPAQVWKMANDALVQIDEDVYEYFE